MICAATAFELVYALRGNRDSCDALELHELLLDWKQVFLLLFKEKGAMVETLVEIALA